MTQQQEYLIPESELRIRILNVLRAFPGGLPQWDIKLGIGLRYSYRCSFILAKLKQEKLVERIIHPISIDWVWRLKQ